MKPEIKKKIIEVSSLSNRTAILKAKGSKSMIYVIMQVYPPTVTSREEDVEKFYNSRTNGIVPYLDKRKHYLMIAGDFISQVGEKEDDEGKYVGNYCYERRNRRGGRLMDFCKENNFIFKKRKSQRWTWISPNHEYKSQIDYILLKTDFNNVQDFRVAKKRPTTSSETRTELGGRAIISFDVIGPFPSILIEPTLQFAEEYLIQVGTNPDAVSEFLHLLRVCLKPNIC